MRLTGATASATTATTGGPPTVTGQALTLVAAGFPTPTSFAFGDGQMFIGGAGNGRFQLPGGGVYVRRGAHQVRKLAGRRPTLPAWPGAPALWTCQATGT